MEVSDLSKSYEPSRRERKEGKGPVEALRGVSLVVNEGEMFALLGPNGAGKTTLFSILSTLHRPTGGSAKVLGHDVVEDRQPIRQQMGIVFQEPALDFRLTARDNLIVMGMLYGLSGTVAKERAAKVLADLELTEAAERTPRELSGGQKRRLELARSLIPSPRLLFLDEATLGLDVDARRTFWAQVRDLARQGRTVVFSTHYMEEADVADRIALIHGGKIIALDSPQSLKARLGGGVILLGVDEREKAASWLKEHGHASESTQQGLMLVARDPAALLPELLKNAPFRVSRAEVREPSLEDVFLSLTGKGLQGERT
ncbi:MAG TPA: ABC transporter ATP-binding protein [Myxococcales bacterium]